MPEKILIVEDDREFAFLLAEKLRDADYDTITANDGFEAIQQVQQARPDLVLLDVMMPRMDGWETLRKIREFSSVPIIMVSCRTSELDKVRGFELGADDYVVKPISHAEFMARIAAALRRKNEPIVSQPIVHVDARLIVDHTRQEAYVHGEPAGLSGIEYKLLACLLDNAGHICPPRTLLVQVWGWEYADQPDYVKVYVHHLRQKIEVDPSDPRYILTERGKGYRFVDGKRSA
jgi:two-component system KDP operon response regulator KdpE